MRMAISEAIKQLTTYTIPCGKYKKAYDMAIDTMRKYEKIEQIIEVWHQDIFAKDFECIAEVAEVVENGKND